MTVVLCGVEGKHGKKTQYIFGVDFQWNNTSSQYIDRYLTLQKCIHTEVLFLRFSIFFRIRLFNLSSGFLYLQKAEKSWPIIFFQVRKFRGSYLFNDVSKYYRANSIEASINLHILLF